MNDGTGEYTFDAVRVRTVMPEDEPRCAVWVFAQDLPKPLAHTAQFVLSGEEWNRDLSPWDAPAVFRGGDVFAGGGPAYLARLTCEVIPACEERENICGLPRGIAGYSLAGLFSLWGCMESAMFRGAASASGSLWFDGFDSYLARHADAFRDKQIVLSLGERESHTRNTRLALVYDRTILARDTALAHGARVQWTMHPGGHFDHPDDRLAQAVRTLSGFLQNACNSDTDEIK